MRGLNISMFVFAVFLTGCGGDKDIELVKSVVYEFNKNHTLGQVLSSRVDCSEPKWLSAEDSRKTSIVIYSCLDKAATSAIKKENDEKLLLVRKGLENLLANKDEIVKKSVGYDNKSKHYTQVIQIGQGSIASFQSDLEKKRAAVLFVLENINAADDCGGISQEVVDVASSHGMRLPYVLSDCRASRGRNQFPGNRFVSERNAYSESLKSYFSQYQARIENSIAVQRVNIETAERGLASLASDNSPEFLEGLGKYEADIESRKRYLSAIELAKENLIQAEEKIEWPIINGTPGEARVTVNLKFKDGVYTGPVATIRQIYMQALGEKGEAHPALMIEYNEVIEKYRLEKMGLSN